MSLFGLCLHNKVYLFLRCSGFPVFDQTTNVLPDQQSMRVERDGDQQWLIVQGKPAQVWPRVRDFWMKQGILIKTEDPRTGIIVTEWVENRDDIRYGWMDDFQYV